jgi:hypothetical protein
MEGKLKKSAEEVPRRIQESSKAVKMWVIALGGIYVCMYAWPELL